MMKQILESGFSAVELMITLFVGFLFVVMGYQLYTVAIQSGGETREEARAGEYAYDRLRFLQAASLTALTCPSTTTDATIDGNKATMTTTISCPMPSVISNLKLVVVKVKYNVSQKEVSHGMYIVR